jgi:hypothetical protein
VGAEVGLDSRSVKIRMRLIVDRRNKIAHEADMDPSNPGFRWTINSKTSDDTIDFIWRVGCAIFKVAV